MDIEGNFSVITDENWDETPEPLMTTSSESIEHEQRTLTETRSMSRNIEFGHFAAGKCHLVRGLLHDISWSSVMTRPLVVSLNTHKNPAGELVAHWGAAR